MTKTTLALLLLVLSTAASTEPSKEVIDAACRFLWFYNESLWATLDEYPENAHEVPTEAAGWLVEHNYLPEEYEDDYAALFEQRYNSGVLGWFLYRGTTEPLEWGKAVHGECVARATEHLAN